MNMIIITMVEQPTINTYKSSIKSIIRALQEVYLNKSPSNILLSILEIKHLTFAYPDLSNFSRRPRKAKNHV